MAFVDEKKYEKLYKEAQELIDEKEKIEDYLDSHTPDTEEKLELEDQMDDIDERIKDIGLEIMGTLKLDLKL